MLKSEVCAGLLRGFGIAIAASLLLSGCSSPEERAAAYLAEAQALFDAGDLVYARIEARNALQIEPKNARARYLMALINEDDGDYSRAFGDLLIAVESDPGYLDARVRLGNYYVDGRKLDEAQEQAEAAMQIDPDAAAVRHLQARTLYLAGDADGARRESDIALQLDPSHLEALTFAAALRMAADQSDEALAVIERGIGDATGDDVAALRRAKIALLRQLGRTESVERELLQLVGDFPDQSSYRLDLATLYVEDGRVEQAEEQVRELIAQDPDNALWRIEMSRLLLALDKAADAEANVLQAIAENPDSDTLRLSLGGFYEASRRRDEALAAYSELAERSPLTAEGLAARNRIVALYVGVDDAKAREVNAAILKDVPNNVDALLSRAAFSIGDDRLDEAIADLRSATVKQPDSERGLLMLARTYLLNGDAELAENAYRRLVALNPANRVARNELATVIGNRGDIEQAAELLRETLQMAPGDVGASRSLVQALLADEDFEGAASEAQRMIDLGESSGLADFQLGLAREAQGDREGAIAAYSSALDKNPAADGALANLSRLLVQAGRPAEAEDRLRRHAEAHPDSTAARVVLADLMAADGRVEEARAAYREVIAQRPETVGAYVGLAGTFAGGSDEQLEVLAQGLEANPGNAQLGLALGSAHKQRDENEEAISVYEAIVAVNGGDDIIVTNLAALLLDERTDRASHARALELVRRFETEASHPFNVAMLGWAYYRNGQPDRAVRHLERAVAEIGQNPKLRYYLGMAYLDDGNEVGAVQELEKAVSMTDAAGGWFDGYEEAVATLKALRADSA